MNRDEALALLNEDTQSQSLIGHALSVEAAMRHYAGRLEGDVDPVPIQETAPARPPLQRAVAVGKRRGGIPVRGICHRPGFSAV